MADTDALEMQGRLDEILNHRPAVGLALAVVRDGALEFFTRHGVADVATQRPVAEDTVFRVASITKTFTAIAVMQLEEQGRLDLDAPANDYLRSYELVPARADWRPATVRHLLTHTAGIGEQVPRSGVLRRDFGESVKRGHRLPTPAEHYGGVLRLDAEPGTMFRYGDHGPTTLGQIVEDLTGTPLASYLREHVFAPLGMTDTTLVRSEVDEARLATGYTLRFHGPRAVPEREWLTVGATNAYSTTRDMARYLGALLGQGGNAHGSVLEPATMARMFAAHYQPHPRIPGMGLAFWRRDAGGHLVVEHQGVMPGFDSVFLAAPDDGVGLFACTNGTRAGGFWLPTAAESLLHRLLGVPDDELRHDVPQHPETWGELCGWYSLPGALTDTRVRTSMGAGAEVFVRDGRLAMRFLSPLPALYRGFPLHPADRTDPYAFELDFSAFGSAPFPVVFDRDGDGTMQVHFELMPMTARRRGRWSNPRVWVESGAGAVAATTVLRRLVREKGSGPRHR